MLLNSTNALDVRSGLVPGTVIKRNFHLKNFILIFVFTYGKIKIRLSSSLCVRHEYVHRVRNSKSTLQKTNAEVLCEVTVTLYVKGTMKLIWLGMYCVLC